MSFGQCLLSRLPFLPNGRSIMNAIAHRDVMTWSGDLVCIGYARLLYVIIFCSRHSFLV